MSITIPPPRERPEGVPLLVWHFLREFRKSHGKKGAAITGGHAARDTGMQRTNLRALMRKHGIAIPQESAS